MACVDQGILEIKPYQVLTGRILIFILHIP